MLVGAGALHARAEVLAVAEKLGSADHEDAARQGGGARTTHPLTTGGIGLLGTGRRGG